MGACALGAAISAAVLALCAAAVDTLLARTRDVFPCHLVGVTLVAPDGGKSCWCTHVCFIHDSMRHSRRAQLYDVPKNYLTRESW